MNHAIKVKRAELLEIVKKNREAHAKEYEEAERGFRQVAIEKMTKNLEAAKTGGEIVLNISLNKPESHVQDYDYVIGLLEMGTDEGVDLDTDDYRQYVKDQWNWSHHFKAVATTYSTLGK